MKVAVSLLLFFAAPTTGLLSFRILSCFFICRGKSDRFDSYDE
ncbi:Uncharacterized protein PAT23_4147 [Pseudomonas aeruginosa]|nr:putative membrane protein [Pseudomonas aeruginosa]EFQ37283.1 hypothetical protein PA39016_000120012 [Pseudomonas aeruginosa 39016]QEN57778.1 Uncharacterized protein PAT23_4147 [Pseudomonas aeruginosa]QEO35858.1 Uncharacterized protein PAT169_1852 [Pseudomonas aeruginosa]RCH05247.1 putative membrane protein [Pseudomonas aeruginosa]